MTTFETLGAFVCSPTSALQALLPSLPWSRMALSKFMMLATMHVNAKWTWLMRKYKNKPSIITSMRSSAVSSSQLVWPQRRRSWLMCSGTAPCLLLVSLVLALILSGCSSPMPQPVQKLLCPTPPAHLLVRPEPLIPLPPLKPMLNPLQKTLP